MIANEEPAAENEKRRQLVERIGQSQLFRRAPRIQQLLAYLTEQSLSSPGADVSEYEIAEKVFGRSAEFDPSHSNIVRVTARELRRKLGEYFDSEGAGEPLAIEIPKGDCRVIRLSCPRPERCSRVGARSRSARTGLKRVSRRSSARPPAVAQVTGKA